MPESDGKGFRKVRLARRSGLVIERPSILTKKRDVEGASPAVAAQGRVCA